jgi:hypothetical protein
MSASAGRHANYIVAALESERVTKIVNKHRRTVTITVLEPVSFSVKSSGSTATLTIGKEPFTRGGRITVTGKPPSGVTDSLGLMLNGGQNAVFSIMPKASGIKPG